MSEVDMAVIKPEVYCLMFYEMFLPYDSMNEKSRRVGQFVSTVLFACSQYVKTNFYAIICIS